jgi:hypothetical protein
MRAGKTRISGEEQLSLRLEGNSPYDSSVAIEMHRSCTTQFVSLSTLKLRKAALDRVRSSGIFKLDDQSPKK